MSFEGNYSLLGLCRESQVLFNMAIHGLCLFMIELLLWAHNSPVRCRKEFIASSFSERRS